VSVESFLQSILHCPSLLKESDSVPLYNRNRDSSVGIATGYGLDGTGSMSGSARFFSSLQCSDRLWAPLSLLSNGYRGLFP
jgi:hypothetical protein